METLSCFTVSKAPYKASYQKKRGTEEGGGERKKKEGAKYKSKQFPLAFNIFHVLKIRI